MGASIALALCDGSRKAIMYGTGSSSPTRPPQLPPATGHVPSACPKRIALGRLRRYGANDCLHQDKSIPLSAVRHRAVSHGSICAGHVTAIDPNFVTRFHPTTGRYRRNLAARPVVDKGRVAVLLRTSIIAGCTTAPQAARAPTKSHRGRAPCDALLGPALSSIARPQFHVERGLSSRPASLTAQLPFERHQARVTRPALQEPRVRDDRLVPAGMAAGAHKVEHPQVLEAEGVARRHGSA